MSKLTKPNVEHVELDQETLDHQTLDQETLAQVSGGDFLRGGLYQAMQTGGVQLGKFGTNNTEAATSAIICDDNLITQTYFCPAKLTG